MKKRLTSTQWTLRIIIPVCLLWVSREQIKVYINKFNNLSKVTLTKDRLK